MRRWRRRGRLAGIHQFEIVGMDACLMGHVEVMEALAPHARYAVFSQETEPALGWAYTAFLGELAKNPDVDGAAVAKRSCRRYIDEDQRITDDQARNEWIGQRGTTRGAQVRSQIGPRHHADRGRPEPDAGAGRQPEPACVFDAERRPERGGQGAALRPVVHLDLRPGGARRLHRPRPFPRPADTADQGRGAQPGRPGRGPER